MRNLFRVIICLVVGLSFIACGPSVIATPSPAPSPIPPTTTAPLITPTAPTPNGLVTRETARVGTVFALQTASTTPLPSPLPTNTPTPAFVPSTLMPTIDPTLVSDLLKNAFSIETLDGVNGRDMRKITGWDYGFGGGLWQGSCSEYYWLDARHLLLYPSAGQVDGPEGYWGAIDVVPQPAVVNLESGALWLPPVNRSTNCKRVYWSSELGILITSEIHDETSTVSTYTYDGYRLSSYPGHLSDLSPSRTKILVSDNTIIDLRTNRKINLNWSLEDYYEPILSQLFWTLDETRIYRCCYFYADLVSGISHRFKRSDFQTTNGNHLDDSGLWFHSGFWVLDDTYFLVWWHAVDDGDIKYLPLFDPATKMFYNVREMAGIPEEFTSLYTPVSPDGNYVWMEGWNESYLVNLTTFESQHYTYSNPYSNTDIDWSSDSKFTWFEINDPDAKSTEFKILSISDMKLHPLLVVPPTESEHLWHPTENMVVYPAKDKNALIFLNASTMSIRELPFTFEKSPYTYGDFTWSPKGEKIALIAADNSLWQVDYPNLEHLEQLTPSLSDVSNVNWSPDGNSIAFVSGSDIYIVETTK